MSAPAIDGAIETARDVLEGSGPLVVTCHAPDAVHHLADDHLLKLLLEAHVLEPVPAVELHRRQ